MTKVHKHRKALFPRTQEEKYTKHGISIGLFRGCFKGLFVTSGTCNSKDMRNVEHIWVLDIFLPR
jgi:hypothetical protein